ncbi:MAG TPA: DUF4062 domain-containing protein, partial [Burkholderiaceae bacterium]|nr:DUF4062 domain-containing protein [Burkholderiaceae bacterium]
MKVFICGTFADLAETRRRVLDALAMIQVETDSMEFFGARPNQPLQTCLAEVAACDVVVVIVGHRYGSLVPRRSISYSEAEYREAMRLGKSCVVYFQDANVPVLPVNVETDPVKRSRLDKWKMTLRARHTVSEFADGHSLAVRVVIDLARIQNSVRKVVSDDV